jgi:putative Ca2+/H+ antiporter (TMEM165/GDT1 family)
MPATVPSPGWDLLPVGEVATAFAVVFLAELGDKTQLVALTLAAQHRAARVLVALVAAIAVLQTLSVTAGALVSRALPDRAIAVAAGLLFLGFAVWTWRSREEDEDVEGSTGRRGLVGAATAFFLAELGDKTMLTTAGLAADHGAVPVWIGSFGAMVASTVLAVLVGRSLTTRVSPAILRSVGAIAFAVVGIATLVSAL